MHPKYPMVFSSIWLGPVELPNRYFFAPPTGHEPADAIARELEGRVGQLFTVGDALSARMLAAATYEGQKFARLIDEPGAPASTSEAWFRADVPELIPMPADMSRPS